MTGEPVPPLATPYAGMAEAWATDAALAYAPLARHLVARSPVPARGALALDAGAGSGAAGAALRAAGARVVAVDLEFDMARYGLGSGPALLGDVTALPFAGGRFDLSVAAFVINHLAEPVRGLAELRRVTRPGGAVLVSVFAQRRARAKAVVEEVAVRYGFRRPDWYDELQRRADAVGTPQLLERVVRSAGFGTCAVTEEMVDLGLDDPALVVRYRMGMPQLRRFVDTLPPALQQRLIEDATAAVARTGERFAPAVIEAVAIA